MAHSPITLRLDDRDRHAVATLHAYYKSSTLSETMGFAIHALTQALEQNPGKEDDPAIRKDGREQVSITPLRSDYIPTLLRIVVRH